MNKELEEAKEYLEHEVKVYENNKEINQLIGGRLGEKQHKINEILLNYIENSIPKEKVEEKINRFKDVTVYGYNDWKYDEKVFHAELNIIDRMKKELLEGK